jgi:hypothetical protein
MAMVRRKDLMRKRRLPIALGLPAVLTAAALVAAPAGARDVSSTAATRTLATATTTDFRVVLVATNLGGGGGAPPARVTVRTFERRAAGGWRPTAERRLPGTYFWKTITGPRAVCRLEITTGGGLGKQPRVVVQLLQSPSLGCGPTATQRLTA